MGETNSYVKATDQSVEEEVAVTGDLQCDYTHTRATEQLN